MLRYDMRFWDKDKKQMIYGAGLSPTQMPIIKHPNGQLEELQGQFVPMICTHQKATNGYIWEADVIECEIPAYLDKDVQFVPAQKARGVMQYNQAQGAFTVNIVSMPQMAGREFKVTKSTIIGCVVANPELLQDSNKQNEQITNQKETQGGDTVAKE